MRLSIRQKAILQLLAQYGQLSGTRLAESVGVSRTSIWRHIHKLKNMGIAIKQDHTRGYCLDEPLVFLSAAAIRQHLTTGLLALPPPLQVHTELKSTNLFLKQAKNPEPWAVCCSETQTAGSGRLGRSWNSPFGQNIYCSINWTFQGPIQRLSGLSLAVSLALQQALSPLAAPELIQIKWPNDLLWQGKKLAGILIDINASPGGGAHVIIGFGININTNTKIKPLSDKPHCSLRDIKQQCFDRNPIIAQCLNQLHQVLAEFEQNGLKNVRPQWQQHDALYNQEITVYQQNREIRGIARGVSQAGNLLVETPSGEITEVMVGDASLRGDSEPPIPFG